MHQSFRHPLFVLAYIPDDFISLKAFSHFTQKGQPPCQLSFQVLPSAVLIFRSTLALSKLSRVSSFLQAASAEAAAMATQNKLNVQALPIRQYLEQSVVPILLKVQAECAGTAHSAVP